MTDFIVALEHQTTAWLLVLAASGALLVFAACLGYCLDRLEDRWTRRHVQAAGLARDRKRLGRSQ